MSNLNLNNAYGTPVVCKYNGVDLATDPSFEVLDIDIKPIPSADGRTVVYNEYTITIKTIVAQANQTANTTTDATLVTLRQALTAYGGQFELQNVGSGDLVLNVAGAVLAAGGAVTGGGNFSGPADVTWGPKPQLLKWKPIGSDQAAEITWTVVVHAPDCPNASYTFPQFLEYSYKLTFDIDQSGYTTRTYSGFFRVPMTRMPNQATRTIQHTADELREKIDPALLPGFRRVYGPFNLSDDKTRMDWSIKDIEVGPNYPPPGVIEASGEHTIESQTDYVSVPWRGHLSVSYEFAKNWNPQKAFAYFSTLLQSRLNVTLNTPYIAAGSGWGVFGVAARAGLIGKQAVVLHSFTMSEPTVYGKQNARFSCGYTFLATLETLLKASSLWQPTGDWNTWSQSLEKSGFAIRGNAGLKALASDDVIIDLCQTPSSTTLKTQPGSTSTLTTGGLPNTSVLRNVLPNSDASFLHYHSTISYEDDGEVVELKALPQSTLTTIPFLNTDLSSDNSGGGSSSGGDFRTGDDGGSGGGATLTSTPTGSDPSGSAQGGAVLDNNSWPGAAAYASLSSNQTSPPAPVVPAPLNNNQQKQNPSVQQRNRPSYYAILEGGGLRAGYTVTPPRLISVGGINVVLSNREGIEYNKPYLAASWFGVPIMGCVWRQRYLIPGVPSGNLFVPGNPLYGT